MKALWFLEQQRQADHEAISQRLFYLAQELGCDVIAQPYVPFREDYDFSYLPTNRPVVFYGSINMVKRFKKSPQNGIVRPFCWFDFEEMACRSYYTHWGKHLLQTNYAFYTFGEIHRLKDELYHRHAKDDCLFIRPDTNDKVFTGEVVHRDRFEAWFALQQDWGVGLLQLCVVSSPAQIDAEYRLVISDNKVLAASRYRLDRHIDKQEGCPPVVKDFADEVVATVAWQPAPIYCMDIAISEGKPRLLEVGEVNCAGLYEMDLRVIVTAMTTIAEREFASAVSRRD